MDRKKLLQIIQKNLDELSEINLEMSQHSKLSDFEIELALSKASMILREYQFLQEICQQENFVETGNPEIEQTEQTWAEPVKGNKEEPGRVLPEPEIMQETPDNLIASQTDSLSNEDEVITGTFLHSEPMNKETTTGNEVNVKQTNTSAQTVPAPETIREQKPTGATKKTLTEQFQSQSLNDLLTVAKKPDQRFAGSPIPKLEKAIGLNDRFQYIRELFGNDAELFSETIGKLDRMHTLEEAVEHLDAQFNWKKDNISLQFMHLVKRRFSI
jgi:hypothetical protein